MNWNHRKPTEAGIYLAKLKGSKEVVAVSVTFWERVPHGEQRRGYYAKSWTGENCHVAQGNPYAVPMKEQFSSWALAHSFGTTTPIVQQCAYCRWSVPLEGRYDQLRCTNEDSREAWGDVEATECCDLFTPTEQ